MIHRIRLSHFRNFSTKEISFCEEKNIIIGKNGHGKSNILEALSLPVAPLVEQHPEYLLQTGEEVFHIQYTLDREPLAFSYEKSSRSKKYIRNGKSTTKRKFQESYPHVVSFHPLLMNLLYLGPSERRGFLDGILVQSFEGYHTLLLQYKKILSHRNKLLRHVSEGKSQEHELDFWDARFIEIASQVYAFRNKIVDFFTAETPSLEEYFFGKISHLRFSYLSKIDISQAEQELRAYIQQSRAKEILLRKTLRGPHLDDFELQIEHTPLTHFASRGEVKSILLGLKFLETRFLETFSPKKEIIFLIDDLLSELDSEHRNLLWKHIGKRQSIVTCIEESDLEGLKIYI